MYCPLIVGGAHLKGSVPVDLGSTDCTQTYLGYYYRPQSTHRSLLSSLGQLLSACYGASTKSARWSGLWLVHPEMP